MSDDKPKDEKEEKKEEKKEPEILFKYEFEPHVVYNLLNYIRGKEMEVGSLIGFRDALTKAINLEEIKKWEEEQQKKNEEKKE